MNAPEGEAGQEKSDPLDQLDMLIEHFRPIEKLFQLMGSQTLSLLKATKM